ncbi:MAG: 2-phospho-L-lactate transferase, partial [Anaerolineaceae bacterium]
MSIRIVALAGGVGGAKLANGLAQVIPAGQLTVVVNTGDDFTHFGLHICPDLDTVCYTLGGLANPETGWGLVGESWRVLEGLKALGAPTWFHLGDCDLATHLERTRRLSQGERLSEVTQSFCSAWGIAHTVLPMSDDPVATRIISAEEGELAFQQYFVERRCQPRVTGFRFEGIEQAKPAPGVIEALETADAVVFCPSNPWVSIDPILAVPGIRERVAAKPVVAVSPIIGGKTVKGPAAKMYAELGIEPSALAVAEHYRSFLGAFFMDPVDIEHAMKIERWGIMSMVTNTIMSAREDRVRLAR